MSTEFTSVGKSFGFEAGERIGVFSNGQLTLCGDHAHSYPELEVVRFALLPDSVKIRAEDGHQLKVGDLRRSLRDIIKQEGTVILPLAVPRWFPGPPVGKKGIFPLSVEEEARGWLVELLRVRKETERARFEVRFVSMKAVGEGLRKLKFNVLFPETFWAYRYSCQVLLYYSKNMPEWKEWCEVCLSRLKPWRRRQEEFWRKDGLSDWRMIQKHQAQLSQS